jgi:hypothetical protein
MTDSNQQQNSVNQRELESDAFDRALDMALARLATAEPRTGLEERILANLQTERRRAAERPWWRWPAVAALASLTVIALSVAWKSGHPKQNTGVEHSPAAMQSDERAGTQLANNAGIGSIPPRDPVSPRKPQPHPAVHAAVLIPAPKLDQFPSPQPLSQQEKMLTEYVAEHHRQAVLVARARMVELKQDLAEEMEEAAAISKPQTSDQSVSQQQER